MVRFSRVCLVAVLMCPPQVIRSRQRMRHDGGNTLRSQDNRAELKALPRNTMECGFFVYRCVRDIVCSCAPCGSCTVAVCPSVGTAVPLRHALPGLPAFFCYSYAV